MNAKKKILSVGLAASLAAVAVVGSSLAYFTDKDEKANEYTIGNVKIDLTEPAWDADDDGIVDEGEGAEEAGEMYPGERLNKDPQVENTGANPAFVRIKVSGDLENINLIGLNTADWELKDGYYYYNKVLEAGAKTAPLFKQIELDKHVENPGDVEAIKTITVEAEAIQAQGAAVQWPRVQTMTVEEIANWFVNREPIAKGK